MSKKWLLVLIAVVIGAPMALTAEAVANAGSEGAETESSLENTPKQDDGVEVDVRLCGCRVLADPDGVITGKICGCTVAEIGKGDFFLVGGAMLGLAALSKMMK